MALPTLSKTWQFAVNQRPGGVSDETDRARQMLWAIKNSLVSFASSPWVVEASCSGTAFKNVGDPSPDLWTSAAVLTWPNPGRPWIVLHQVGTGMRLCFLGNLTYRDYGTVLVAPGPFNANGTVSAAPTATGSYTFINANFWGISEYDGTYTNLHILHSTDGEATRILFCRGIATTGYWFFEKPVDAPVLWITPQLCKVAASGYADHLLTEGNFTNGSHRGWFNGVTINLSYVLEISSAGALTGALAAGDEDTLEFPLLDVAVAGVTIGYRGMRGRAVDVWGGAHGKPVGTQYPQDGSRQFAQFGDFIFPWNGTQCIVS